MNNKYLEAFNLTEKDLKEIKFPLLIWSDLDDKTKIVLLTTNLIERDVVALKGQSILEYINKIDGGVEEFLDQAKQGDETLHTFKLVEFEDDVIDWDSLINEYEKHATKLPYLATDFEPIIADELNNNYLQDIKASFMECVYNSIILNMHSYASDLSIESMGFLGDFSLQDRFRLIIHKNLNKEFDVILGN